MTEDVIYKPTPEFRARLEQDIERTFRQEAARRSRLRGRLRVAAIIAVSVAIGTTTGLASAQVRDSARRDSILTSAQADLTIIALRLELARAGVDDATRKYRLGATGSETVASAEAELRQMEAQAGRMKLNIEEIYATAQPPRDELTAPLVGSRDFVKERINLDLLGAQQRLIAAERASAEAQRRVSVGAVGELVQSEAELETARARATLQVLAQRLSLRREFVEKGTSAGQLAARLELAQVQAEIKLTQQSQQLAQARLETIQRQQVAGVATKLDAMRAEIDVQMRGLELQQLAIRLRRLELQHSATKQRQLNGPRPN